MSKAEKAAAKDQREAEEAKVAEEIREHMERISAEVDRLEQLDPTDLEVNEGLARTIAGIHEVDAVMRAKCRNYPAELAKWEDGVMAPVRVLEAIISSRREMPSRISRRSNNKPAALTMITIPSISSDVLAGDISPKSSLAMHASPQYCM